MAINYSIIYFRIFLTILICLLGFIFPKNKTLFIIQFLWLSLLTCLNTNSVDWEGNEGQYIDLDINTPTTIFNFFYKTIVIISKKIGWNFISFNGLFSFISTVLIVLVIIRFTKNRNIVLSLWLIYPFIDNVIQKRAYYALGILIIALPLLFNEQHKIRNIICYEMIMILVVQIHIMYILYMTIPFFLLLKPKIQKYIIVTFILLGIALRNNFLIIVNNLLGPTMEDKSQLYFQTIINGVPFSHILIWFFWQLFEFFIMYFLLKDSDKHFDQVILSLNYWSLLLIPLYLTNSVFIRVFRAILLFNDIAVAKHFRLTNNKIEKRTFISFGLQFIFLILSLTVADINSDLGIENMIFEIFRSNLLFH